MVLFHLDTILNLFKFLETENRMVVPRGLGEKGELLFKGDRIVLQDERSSGDGSQNRNL